MDAGDLKMELKYKKGCLIAALKNHEVEAIAHQANCFHTMKSGIAPQIVKAWHSVRLADLETNYGDKDKMGSASRAFTQDGLVFNIYGQYHWSRKCVDYGTSYKHLGLGLRHVRLLMDVSKAKSLGLPRIGCGLAGGDWGVVERLIKDAFEDSDIEVTVYELE